MEWKLSWKNKKGKNDSYQSFNYEIINFKYDQVKKLGCTNIKIQRVTQNGELEDINYDVYHCVFCGKEVTSGDYLTLSPMLVKDGVATVQRSGQFHYKRISLRDIEHTVLQNGTCEINACSECIDDFYDDHIKLCNHCDCISLFDGDYCRNCGKY